MSKNENPRFVPVDFDPFVDGDLAHTTRATESQKEIWTTAQLGDDANCAFNESVSVCIEGQLDEDALADALDQMVQRHEALRTTLSPDGEQLCIASSSFAELLHLDFSGTRPDVYADAYRQVHQEVVTTPFDLVRGPLARFWMIRLADERWELIICVHHIICDGWSTGILLRDLGSLYQVCAKGAPNLRLQNVTPFSTYAERINQRNETETREFWIEKFEQDVPTLDWPTDRPRPPLRTFDSDRIDTEIHSELAQSLKTLAARHRSTFFTLLLAAWQAYTARITGGKNVVTGIPAAGQSVSDMSDVVGHCVNLLPLRISVDLNETFLQLLSRTREELLEAFDHQDYTFGRLIKEITIPRDPSRIPLVPVQFNIDQTIDGSELGFDDLSVTWHSNPRAYENFELFLNLVENRGGVQIQVQYNTGLFDRETIRYRIEGFEAFLKAIALEPKRDIGSLPTLGEDERRQVLEAWNQTDLPVDPSITVDRLILRQIERVPDAIAVECCDETMSYRSLGQRSLALASKLMSCGVRPGELVGIALERSIDMVTAALAIWRCGAAYVPLDPEFPRARLQSMLDDSGLRIIVTENSLAERLSLDHTNTIALTDIAWDEPAETPGGAGLMADAIAYVIYTSGSTGQPKGVEIPHRAVCNFLRSMARKPGLSPEDRLLAVTTLSFDISILELFLPLTIGARTVIATAEETRDSRRLQNRIRESHATHMQATPATWRMLVESDWVGGEKFTAICGGENFPKDLAQTLFQRAGRVFNMYGPTETTIWSTLYELKGGEEIVPIGQPIDNTRVYVLDANLEPTGVGVPGELYIGGLGVSHGYLGKPALTESRFIASPFRPSETLYRTGDFVRWNNSGDLIFSQRLDDQVKVRGYRIELGDIESALVTHFAVSEAVVNVYEDEPGDARLAAYYVSREKSRVDAAELRTHLGQLLPAYMIPQHFIRIDSVPLTLNKKANRKALPEPENQTGRTQSYQSPAPGVESQLAEIWCEILKVDRVGSNDDFFDLGGHSILATRVVAKIAERMGVELPLRRIFATPRLRELAEYLEAMDALTRGSATEEHALVEREEVSF